MCQHEHIAVWWAVALTAAAVRLLAAQATAKPSPAAPANSPVASITTAFVSQEESPKGPAAVKQVIAILERPWQENVSDEKLDEAAASLKPMADEAVDEIMQAFDRSSQTFVYRHRAVQILQRLKTKKAGATLLDIALGHSAEDLPSMKQWASAAYLRTTQDYSDVRKLLASEDWVCSAMPCGGSRASRSRGIAETALQFTAYQGIRSLCFKRTFAVWQRR